MIRIYNGKRLAGNLELTTNATVRTMVRKIPSLQRVIDDPKERVNLKFRLQNQGTSSFTAFLFTRVSDGDTITLERRKQRTRLRQRNERRAPNSDTHIAGHYGQGR